METKETPHIDSLARNGLRLTDFHVGASVCTPSRAALLTGRLGLRTGVVRNFDVKAEFGLPRNETTIAEMLKAVNYSTGMIGKWHLGTNGRCLPTYRGFDFYYGLPYSNDMGCTDNPGYDWPMCSRCPTATGFLSRDEGLPIGDCDTGSNDSVPLYKDTRIIQQPVDLATLTNQYVKLAVEFINNQSSRPFFLYVAFAHTHVPLSHDIKYTNASERKTVFADTLLELDASVGAIVQAVKDNGQEGNTLIWFTSDNGPWESKCQYHGLVGPYKGLWEKKTTGGSSAKQTTWEGGHRVPGIVYWPGVIAPRVSNALASTLDVLPTIANILKVPLPKNRLFDGIDISHVLFNGSDSGHSILFHPNDASGIAGAIDTIRFGDYKVMYQTGGSAACNSIAPPPVRHDPPLMFNLRDDPGESKPLNVSIEPQVKILQQVLHHLHYLHESIKNDNISVTSYSQDDRFRPCCNIHHVVCRCEN
ncbi:arylsulfatase G-like [Corticium candelabrum]|uniref:arylsulfatase G-like n=1 Tax=Corticium candelabrum TaxID=121492 RepID=UPI002E32F1A9|nr:arylsulfatase G-like [Corticium candelabrum]